MHLQSVWFCILLCRWSQDAYTLTYLRDWWVKVINQVTSPNHKFLLWSLHSSPPSSPPSPPLSPSWLPWSPPYIQQISWLIPSLLVASWFRPANTLLTSYLDWQYCDISNWNLVSNIGVMLDPLVCSAMTCARRSLADSGLDQWEAGRGEWRLPIGWQPLSLSLE